jgi:hypothetical protein
MMWTFAVGIAWALAQATQPPHSRPLRNGRSSSRQSHSANRIC